MNDYGSKVPLSKCDFEVAPLENILTGTMEVFAYEENSDEAKTIVSTDEDVTIKVVVRLQGLILHQLCGQLCICVYLESIGPGREYRFPDPCRRIDLDPCGDGVYVIKIVIPAGDVSADECGALYIVAVTLTSFDVCGNPGHIAAYCKDACLMFYNPPHPEPGEENG
jgi:hypothetical protein